MCVKYSYASIPHHIIGRGKHSGTDFMTHPNHLHTLNLLKYTRSIKFSPIEIVYREMLL